MPLYTGEPTLLERDPRAWVRSCSRPTCLRRRFDKPRSRSFPPSASPLPSPPLLFPRFRYSSRYLSYPRYTHACINTRTCARVCVCGDRRNERNRRNIRETGSKKSIAPELVPSRKEGGGTGRDGTKRVGRRSEATSREEIVTAW